MIRRKKERPKWRYDFNCRKCDNIQEIHDNREETVMVTIVSPVSKEPTPVFPVPFTPTKLTAWSAVTASRRSPKRKVNRNETTDI